MQFYFNIMVDLAGFVASKLGVPPEAFRLLLTLLAGYPIAAAYHKYVADKPKTVQHLYFALSGMGLCYYNYGTDTYHSLLAISVTFALVTALRSKPLLLLIINFVFHMSYLLLGYYYTASNEYDILWTMPHCILTLRMIGFGFDISDGLRKEEELSKDQKETALRDPPNFLELLAFAYFPSSFLVGPQFPYRRYQSFTNGEFRQYDGYKEAGLKRLGAGVLYLAVCQAGLTYLPDGYFLSPEFAAQSFIKRIYFLGFWAKFSLYKYISCWLFAEGALMYLGFTYKGLDELGNADWTGCSNVKLKLLESGNTMQHYVQSFNVNTNQWVAHYVFKRLKFLNNRNISYGAALGFLAIWHGYHSGYYMAFLMEYMIVSTEKQIESVYTKQVLPKYGETLNNSKIYSILYFFCLKSYNIVYMGWCLTSFVFLKYERWITVYSAVNYFGFIYMLIWACIYHGYRYYRKTQPREPRPSTSTKQD
ncbi:lysophospholipid acyltransferase 5 isoform X1 [Drosophila sulfurigaster albostrigata]|uniref:lysophospholipid acyltransferase 5 isoform X1 n=2 Tax=Drosophila sulfurigaster albostrigata TaxID=89887 RepID=UPI002D2196C1|nr:lysophospholipid acyltransferase 5 isoform X1 [Drosophila sulfurigaster albostrigata]